MRIFDKLRGFVSPETPKPQDFARRIIQKAEKLEELIRNLANISPNLPSTPLSEISATWGAGLENPLGSLAEMGFPGADEKINPQLHIYETLNTIKYEIAKLRQQMDMSTNAQKIVGIWEKMEFELHLSEMPINKFPAFLKDFSERLNCDSQGR